jgi:hypothetical protein
VASIPKEIPLGPDGFIGAFYHNYWDIVKGDVTAAVQQLSQLRGQTFTLLNTTNIVLLPKKLLVSEGESIKLDQPLTSNPNVGGFGEGDAEIVLQDPLRVQGLLFFFASVILTQVFLVLKKKQFEMVQLYEMNF